MPPIFTPAQMRSGGSGSSVMTDTDYAEAYTYSMGLPRQGVGGLAPGAGPSLTSYPIKTSSQHPNPFIGPIGDTDSSSDFEAIPTPGGLRFRDTPSPTGSKFNTPPTSLVDRAASITDDEEEDAQFGTPRASLAGSFRSGPQGSFPVQLHGPVFQESSLYNSSAMGGGGSQQYDLPDLRAGFNYPEMPQPGLMPAGHGPIRTLAGPQGPQGPPDAFAPFAGLSLSSSDSSPEQSGAAAGYEGYPYHPYMPHQRLPHDLQNIPMGSSSPSGDHSFEEGPSHSLGPYGQPLPQGSHTPFQDPVSSSPDCIPPVGEMTHAPSSHFVSSGSFDFGGRVDEGLGEWDTAGLLPNLGSQPLQMTELELESFPGSETLASPREYGHYPAAATHGPTGPAGPDTGPTVNPMFGTDILDTRGSDVGQAQRRNPVWESHSRLEPQGGAPNPLYGSAADMLASRDSLGAMRNPVWESHSAEAPVGSSNPPFATGVLDTTDSINGGNPLFESNRRRQDGQQ